MQNIAEIISQQIKKKIRQKVFKTSKIKIKFKTFLISDFILTLISDNASNDQLIVSKIVITFFWDCQLFDACILFQLVSSTHFEDILVVLRI